MQAAAVRVALPGGSWLDGARVQTATVRPITGADEAMLVELADTMLPAERSSALLNRCITVAAGSASAVVDSRQLCVGDREALLLHLYRVTFGDALHCVFTCPNGACNERMDVELSASMLLTPPYEQACEWYEFSHTNASGTLRFRLPTGLDQESAAALVRTDSQAASETLAQRCVAADESSGAIAPLDPDDYQRLAAAMLDRDPQAEITLVVRCPSCRQTSHPLFDAGGFLYETLAARAPRLYREVHTLALYYHWGEAEILGLTQPQRQRYLDLLAESTGVGAR